MEQENVIIELKEMSKSFTVKNGVVHALDKINLKINRGEIFGIIGMSGAGKSTLVRCINLLERPTEGQVIFDGQDLTVLKPAQLRQARRSMGMIFQQFNLLMQKTALENVCFPLEISGVKKEDAKKRAEELLEIVGLEERKDSYPAQLSGGQKQRVAIARALTTNPKVLLCDEATSALDPNILELLKDINKRLGITVVIITHEMSVIEEICQRVAIIDSSKIAEIGTVEKIFTAPKSNIGKQLVYSESKPKGEPKAEFDDTNKRYCRIVFDGETSFKPILANMILECQSVVNILYANTRNIDGQAYGQMVVQLPPEERIAKKIIAYLETQDVNFEEVDYV